MSRMAPGRVSQAWFTRWSDHAAAVEVAKGPPAEW